MIAETFQYLNSLTWPGVIGLFLVIELAVALLVVAVTVVVGAIAGIAAGGYMLVEAVSDYFQTRRAQLKPTTGKAK